MRHKSRGTESTFALVRDSYILENFGKKLLNAKAENKLKSWQLQGRKHLNSCSEMRHKSRGTESTFALAQDSYILENT